MRSSSISGTLVGHEPELAEDLADLAHGLDARVERAACDGPTGRRDIDRLRGEPSLECGATQRSSALGQCAFDRGTDGIRHGTDTRPVLGRKRTDAAQNTGQAPLLAEDVEFDRLDRRDVRGGLDRRERVVAQRLEFSGQIG